MKKLISVLALALATGAVFAQDVTINRRPLGSGQPGTTGVESVTRWSSDSPGIYQLQQYMPGYPTAAPLWARAVDVQCTKNASTGKLACEGYEWQPKYGRAEYLFANVVIAVPPEPKVIVTEKVVKVEVPKIIEVPKPCCHHHHHKPIKE